jgi:methionyl-tRNA formyltransferase
MGAFRIVFMGTPAFAAVALKALVDAGHEVIAVYSQPPRPKGRGMETQKSPVHMLAEEQGIPVRTPASLRSAAAAAAFSALQTDVAVVAAYGLILPKAVLAAPRHGCLNIHASLLPRWRGAAPIQRAILAGDPETGVTIMQMTKRADARPMLLKEELAIGAA